MKQIVLLAIGSLAFAVLLHATASAEWDARASAWWKHVAYLASDDLEGRNVGSAGYEKAARYVAAQFESAGLKPAGSNGYFQPVSFLEASIDAPKSKLTLLRGDNTMSIPVPKKRSLAIRKIQHPRSKLLSFLPATD